MLTSAPSFGENFKGNTNMKRDAEQIFRVKSIREEFDPRLVSAGVDCFTVFAEDLWQPGQLIPQDIDAALYYPEATYAAPDSAFHRDSFKKLKESELIYGIKSAFFPIATDGPGSVLPEPAGVIYGRYDPLFQPFLVRERIVSTSVFAPESSFIDKNTLQEILFLNFRSPQLFNEDQRLSLLSLAYQILRYVPKLAAGRNRRAYGPARRTIRAFSSLVKSLDDQLFNPAFAPDDESYEVVAKQLHSVLRLETETIGEPIKGRSDNRSQLVVSIYLTGIPSSNSDLSPYNPNDLGTGTTKIEPYLLLRGSSIGDKHTRKTQRLYDPSEQSITVCSTVTNCPHLLQHVDPCSTPKEMGGLNRHVQEITIELTNTQLETAQLDPAILTTVSYRSMDELRRTMSRRAGPTSGPVYQWRWYIAEGDDEEDYHPPRLILWTPYLAEIPAHERALKIEALLVALSKTKLGRTWPWIIEKVRARSEMQYANLFGTLDIDWLPQFPSSEVCVPIRFAGQSIGCVNIESGTIDRFNFTYVGLLSSFATVIGMMAARELDLNMSRELQTVLQEIHSRKFVPDCEPDEDALGQPVYSSHILEDKYKLNNLARSLAKACWAERCCFVSTGSHEDDPTRFLATSDILWHNKDKWKLPREDGLVAWLSRQPANVLGLVVDKTKVGEESLLVRAGSSPTGVVIDESLSTDLPKMRSRPEQPDAERIVLCRLPDFRADRKLPHFARTVIILSYNRKVSALCGVTNDRIKLRRDRFLTYVFSLCQRCSGIADHWNSALLERLTVQENIGHAQEFMAIERGWTSFEFKNADVQRRAYYQMRDAWVGQKIAHFLSMQNEPLNADTPQFYKMPLSRLVDEAILAAKAKVDCYNEPKREIQDHLLNAILDADGAVFFYYLLTQAISNSLENVEKESPTTRVIVFDGLTSEQQCITCRIEDNGDGFPQPVLRSEEVYRRRLPVLIAGKRGRGFDLMSRVARKLNPGAADLNALDWGNMNGGGAFLEFHIPIVRFQK